MLDFRQLMSRNLSYYLKLKAKVLLVYIVATFTNENMHYFCKNR